MLTADRVVGALVLLKTADVGLRGPGALPAPLWAVAVLGLAAGGVCLLAGPAGRVRGWVLVLLAAGAVAVDAPLELRRQHLVLLLGTALAAVVAQDGQERLLLWRVQLSALYGVAALAKVNETFLGGDVLALALAQGPLSLRLPTPLLLGLGVLVVALEALLAVAPWVVRLRLPALGLGAALHVGALALAGDVLVGLRLVFFGGLAVALLAASAGLLAQRGARTSATTSAVPS